MKQDDTNNQAGGSSVGGSADWELSLARQVRALPRHAEPVRDLWPGIERRIAEYPQRRRGTLAPPWLALGVAASLTMAASALTLSIVQSGQPDPQMQVAGQAVSTLAREYLPVRNPLVEQFNQVNADLAPETLNDLYRNLEILAQARREIEDQIRSNPEDNELVEMLIQIHEQEIDLLKRDYLAPSRSL